MSDRINSLQRKAQRRYADIDAARTALAEAESTSGGDTPPGPKRTGSWSGTRRSFPKHIAKRILRRDGECQGGWSPACNGEAEEADHIVGARDAERAGWDPGDIEDESNGQALCHPCHDMKTRAEIKRGAAIARAERKRKLTVRKPTRHPGVIQRP